MFHSREWEPEALEALKGRRLGPYLSHNPVNATQIWQWCSVMGDNNPLYQPGDNQLAPPAMMQMWTMRDIDDRYAPGSTDAFPYQVFAELTAQGYPANVAVSYDIRFYRYLRTGERAKHFTTVANISERKTTALGAGYFVTERVEYLTEDDTAFAEALITYFQYAPASATNKRNEQEAASPASSATTSQAPVVASESHSTADQEASRAALAVGDILPELAIPITHRLIVAGAIATQDFTPVHHDVPAARSAGMPDIFMNILTTCGLSVRYLTDWAGAGSRLKKITFKLLAPNVPGDVMRLRGEVSAVNLEPSGSLVDIAFTGQNRLGIHISGSATLAMPTTVR
jgi:acyl dehydratase